MTGRVEIKPGVEFTVIAPAGYLILDAIKGAAQSLDLTLTITSGTDSQHSGPNDPHHRGEAFDVRSKPFSSVLKQRILGEIHARLGTQRFFAFLEAAGTENEHFHIQKRKGTVFTVRDFFDWEGPR